MPREPKKAKAKAQTKTKGRAADVHVNVDPYPLFAAPSPEQCRSARDSLLALHGFPHEFAQFQRNRSSNSQSPSHEEEQEQDQECEEEQHSQSLSVLDGLILTLLSQNTTDSNSRKAFHRLKSAFPSWDLVLQADSALLQDAIRCGGLARTKAARIQTILTTLRRRTNHLCLEYLRGLSIPQVKAHLSHFKGIGPKTIACLLMFYLNKDDFPVDTHVFQITKAIGWIPTTATRETAYLHLNHRIPNELKFDLNCLFVTHGKLCRSCKQPMQVKKSTALCPLLTQKANVNKHEV